ncbi:MAG: hypothetical protein WD995_00750 [Gemmatimonadota bacterium]
MSRARAVGSPLLAACVGAALACAHPGHVAAQSAFSFGGGIGGFTGGDFSGTPPGPTIGAAVHLPFEDEGTEIGLGVEYSRYGGHGFVGATTQLDYSGTIRRQVAPGAPEVWLGVKVGYSTRSLSVVEEPARTDGFLMGPAVSLRAPVALGASLDLSMELPYHTYEELIMYASREHGTDQDGLRFVLRMGLMVPVPAWGREDGETSPGGW